MSATAPTGLVDFGPHAPTPPELHALSNAFDLARLGPARNSPLPPSPLVCPQFPVLLIPNQSRWWWDYGKFLPRHGSMTAAR